MGSNPGYLFIPYLLYVQLRIYVFEVFFLHLLVARAESAKSFSTLLLRCQIITFQRVFHIKKLQDWISYLAQNGNKLRQTLFALQKRAEQEKFCAATARQNRTERGTTDLQFLRQMTRRKKIVKQQQRSLENQAWWNIWGRLGLSL